VAIIAAIAMLSICATAFTVSGGGDAEVGGTVTVNIVSGGGDESFDGIVSYTGGLAINRATGMAAVNASTGAVAFAAADGTAGDIIGAIVFDVTAAGAYTITIDGKSVSGTIGGGGDDIVTVPGGGDEEPGGGTVFVPTGVAVAIVPALIAGAAAVATRKRK